jgi:hypothetical protein
VGYIPGCLIGNAEVSLQLAGRDPFLGITHQRDGGKPLAEWQMGIVKQSAGQRTELELAGHALK